MLYITNIEQPKENLDVCWNSLDKDSKRSFGRFASCNDKSIGAMIEFTELFVRHPQLTKLRLPTRSREIDHFPLNAAILHYGMRDTNEAVAVHLIKTILEQNPEAVDERVSNCYGFDWMPTRGWTPLGISCLKQCHPKVIRFLRDEMLKRNLSSSLQEDDPAVADACDDFSTPEALFAALLIQNVEMVQSLVQMDPQSIDAPLSIRRRSDSSSDWRSPLEFSLLLQGPDFVSKIKAFFHQLHDDNCRQNQIPNKG